MLKLNKGHSLYSTRCRKLLTLAEDTVGEHDILFSSCSAYDYRVRFDFSQPHASCLGILGEVLAPHGIPQLMIPDPFNIFQHSHIAPDFKLSTKAPLSKAVILSGSSPMPTALWR